MCVHIWKKHKQLRKWISTVWKKKATLREQLWQCPHPDCPWDIFSLVIPWQNSETADIKDTEYRQSSKGDDDDKGEISVLGIVCWLKSYGFILNKLTVQTQNGIVFVTSCPLCLEQNLVKPGWEHFSDVFLMFFSYSSTIYATLFIQIWHYCPFIAKWFTQNSNTTAL